MRNRRLVYLGLIGAFFGFVSVGVAILMDQEAWGGVVILFLVSAFMVIWFSGEPTRKPVEDKKS